MKCDCAREQLSHYAAGELSEGEKSAIDRHLSCCNECQRELAEFAALWSQLGALPEAKASPDAAARFHVMLDACVRGLQAVEQEAAPPVSRIPWLTTWRMPALTPRFGFAFALFAAGVILGLGISRQQIARRQNAQLQAEIAGMRQAAALALMQQPSASERLQGVNWSSQVAQPDREVLDALLRALDSDPNPNVRLAAIGALQEFVRFPEVRHGLVRALAEQDSPLVQIELINVLANLADPNSAPLLRKLSENPETDPNVRERAAWALQKLLI